MKQNKHRHAVWIIEDDKALGTMLQEEVRDAGLEAHWVPTAESALRDIWPPGPELIVCDLKLPGMDGLNVLRVIRDKFPDAPPGFLMITAFGTIPKAVNALRAGADDFLTKPLDLEHFMLCVQRIIEKKQLREMVTRMRLLSSESFHGLSGKSASMRRVFGQIKQVAKSRGPVMILGESGTGKELVARAIHEQSDRSKGPFLPVNCAGIPEHLLESEFFGHAEGSFTGARKNRRGLFAEAQGGTLFLDEISEMPASLQAKLLRMLHEGKVRRLGENREEQVDVRVLAATHRDLEEDVRQGRFRQDLFFRLETFTLHVPPLRQRGDDIELLAAGFLQEFSMMLDKEIQGFSSEALERITAYPFPGNVRELRNAMERAVTFAAGNLIQVEDLPSRMRNNQSSAGDFSFHPALLQKEESLLPLDEIERRYIRHVLEQVDGNKRRAASILGIGRRTLYRKFEQDAASSRF